MKKTAIYCRVSSDRQAKTGDSIREQVETLTEYVNKSDTLTIYDTYIDDGISGTKLDRDEFTRLISDIKSGKIDLVVFTKLDRWFRSLRHYLNTQDILEKHNVTWIAVSQPFYNTDSPQGRAFIAQSMAFAQLEAENDGVRIKDVFENKVKNGEVISGNVPLGFKIDNKHLVKSDDAIAIKDCFEYYLQSVSIEGTKAMLRDKYGIVKCSSSIRRILKNEKYIGKYRDNPTYCERIIDDNLFYSVQDLLNNNIAKCKKNDYLFSGLIKCKECGNKYTGVILYGIGHPRKDGTRKRYYRKGYRCHTAYDAKTCSNRKVIYESTLEKYLINNLNEYIRNYVSEYKISQQPVIDNNYKKNSIRHKLSKLKELFLNDLISIDEYKQDKETYEKELDSLGTVNIKQKDVSNIESLLKVDLVALYERMDYKDKQIFWHSIISAIEFSKSRDIELYFL